MVRHRTTAFVCVCLAVASAARNEGPKPATLGSAAPAPERADPLVRALADTDLDGFFPRNPDRVTLLRGPGRHHDALPDNGSEALRGWQAKEEAAWAAT